MMIYAERIRGWASDRNLISGSTPERQFLKLIEEIGELGAGMARGNHYAVMDGIGDAFVVLTILAAQHGMDIEECIAAAWSEIKDRKGRMVDGIWIKNTDQFA